ncbi:MAG: hypothetical protein AAF798_17650 [Bacteroidota bacterium]
MAAPLILAPCTLRNRYVLKMGFDLLKIKGMLSNKYLISEEYSVSKQKLFKLEAIEEAELCIQLIGAILEKPAKKKIAEE